MKTIKLYTLGCKVNQYDTQAIREQFFSSGFKEICNGKGADVCVINTCTVTHRADSDSIGAIRRAIRDNPKAKIIVTGCLTELDGDKIKEIKGVNLIVKNNDKGSIAERSCGKRHCEPRRGEAISFFKGHTRAFLKIQDGCDNFCSYCKVPLVRGCSRSKKLEDVVSEARRLINNGFKEIVLTGICLGAYGKDLKPKISLVDVLEKLEDIEGLLRIRLSSIEAGDVSRGLIEQIAKSKKICRHLHIPIQSGDDKILRLMNRKYSRAGYTKLIAKIKEMIPQVAITTDVLVGFPGENERNFQNTVKLVKRIQPLKVHIFPYSKREGTLAAWKFKKEVPAAEIKNRLAHLRGVQEVCAREYKSKFLGKKMSVLIEGRAKFDPLLWEGYTDNYIRVLIKSKKDLKNKLFLTKPLTRAIVKKITLN